MTNGKVFIKKLPEQGQWGPTDTFEVVFSATLASGASGVPFPSGVTKVDYAFSNNGFVTGVDNVNRVIAVVSGLPSTTSGTCTITIGVQPMFFASAPNS